MASLRFNFDGERRPSGLGTERRGVRPPVILPIGLRYLRPRAYPGPFSYPAGTQEEEEINAGESSQEEIPTTPTDTLLMPGGEDEKEANSLKPEKLQNNEEAISEPVLAEPVSSGSKEAGAGEKTGEKAEEEQQGSTNSASTSEVLIQTLGKYEANLNQVRGQVDLVKEFFDTLIYKLDSAAQIMEIIQANEERSINKPQVQLTANKTSRDMIDEVLELLQTPAIQNIVRQFLMGFLVKKR